MKRNVFMDGNGSGTVMIEGLGPYVPVSQVRSMQAEVERLQAAHDDLQIENTSLEQTYGDDYVAIEQERDQLKAHVQRFMEVESDQVTLRVAVQSAQDATPEICLADHDAEVIERFKDELVKSVSVVFRPHIEGVCAVVQQQLRQQAKEAHSCSEK